MEKKKTVFNNDISKCKIELFFDEKGRTESRYVERTMGDIPISKTVNIDISRREKGPNNILLIGGPASGKTSCGTIPVVKNADCNFVVMDTNSEILYNTKDSLRSQGYRIVSVETNSKSDEFNIDIFNNLSEPTLKAIAYVMSFCGRPEERLWQAQTEIYIRAVLHYFMKKYPKDLNEHSVFSFFNKLSNIENFEAFAKEYALLPEEKEFSLSKILLMSRKTLQSVLISAVTLFEQNFKTSATVSNTVDFDFDNSSLYSDKVAIFINVDKYSEISMNIASVVAERIYNALDRHDNPRHTIFIFDEPFAFNMIDISNKLSVSYHSNISFLSVFQCEDQTVFRYGKVLSPETDLSKSNIQIYYGNEYGSSIKYIYDKYKRCLQHIPNKAGEIISINCLPILDIEAFVSILQNKNIIFIGDDEFFLIDNKNR